MVGIRVGILGEIARRLQARANILRAPKLRPVTVPHATLSHRERQRRFREAPLPAQWRQSHIDDMVDVIVFQRGQQAVKRRSLVSDREDHCGRPLPASSTTYLLLASTPKFLQQHRHLSPLPLTLGHRQQPQTRVKGAWGSESPVAPPQESSPGNPSSKGKTDQPIAKKAIPCRKPFPSCHSPCRARITGVPCGPFLRAGRAVFRAVRAVRAGRRPGPTLPPLAAGVIIFRALRRPRKAGPCTPSPSRSRY